MPRIIGGRLKNRTIPKSTLKTRPILARVKNSLFSSIKDRLNGAYFLDLYAGSGSCGIEALSRNASFCVFVEKDKEQARKIRETLNKLDFKNALVLCCNVFSLRLKEKFDIIFLGPPYDENLSNKTMRLIEKKAWLKEGGIVIAQHHKKEKIENKIGSLSLIRQKSFGETILSFYENSNLG